ncbi:MAG: hypothetical protein KGJ19_02220 [Betaproteobacteria bacterium]|nr:hypothetical protein [Betaproteobacteria bacterium]
MKSTLNEWKEIGGWLPAIVLIGTVLTLAACSEKPQSPAPQVTPQKLFQQERGALEKTKGVVQTEAKSAEDLKQEAEKQAQ